MRAWSAVFLGAALCGCAGDKGRTETGDDSGPPPDDTGNAETGEPEAPSDDVCERFTPGPSSSEDAVIGLSEAHADYRLFGPAEDFPTADDALDRKSVV